jgi:hypothetical protein
VCLSILGGIQPGPLSDYLRAAALGDKGADGLVQRFQLAVYPDPPRSWTNVDEWPHTEAKNRAFDIFKKLVDPLTFEGFAGPFGQKTEAVPEHQEDILFFRLRLKHKSFLTTGVRIWSISSEGTIIPRSKHISANIEASCHLWR